MASARFPGPRPWVERRCLNWLRNTSVFDWEVWKIDEIQIPSGVSPKLTRFPQAHSTGVVLCSLCPPKKVVGCRGGNQKVEGGLLTFGHLMLDDSLGFPYYRLINIG